VRLQRQGVARVIQILPGQNPPVMEFHGPVQVDLSGAPVCFCLVQGSFGAFDLLGPRAGLRFRKPGLCRLPAGTCLAELCPDFPVVKPRQDLPGLHNIPAIYKELFNSTADFRGNLDAAARNNIA